MVLVLLQCCLWEVAGRIPGSGEQGFQEVKFRGGARPVSGGFFVLWWEPHCHVILVVGCYCSGVGRRLWWEPQDVTSRGGARTG